MREIKPSSFPNGYYINSLHTEKYLFNTKTTTSSISRVLLNGVEYEFEQNDYIFENEAIVYFIKYIEYKLYTY